MLKRITGYFDISKRLKTSKRLFYRNSELYQNITGLLDSFVSQMDQKVTTESAEKLFETERELKEKVSLYLATRKHPITPAGRARYKMMKELMDFNGVSNVLSDVTKIEGYEKAGKKLIDVVTQVRNDTTIDITKKDKKFFGAGASRRIRFEHNGHLGFFTGNEVVPNLDEAISRERNRFIAEHRELIDKHKPVVMSMINEATSGGASENTSKTKAFKMLTEFVGKVKISDFREEEIETLGGFYLEMSKIHTMYSTATYEAGIEEKREIGIRNVATSRVAHMMKMGDKIAFAEAMTVKDGDVEIKGSFMESAKGFDSRSKPGSRFFIDNKVKLTSGSFQRDLNRMQVLDMLCGQVDRHGGNMFYQLDRNNNVIGLQGIDNDMSFGKIDLAKDHQRLRPVSSLNIIDREMYDCLKAYTPEKIRYSMGDILNEAEVDAMITRREQILSRVKSGGARIVEIDEWGTKTLDETRESSYYKEVEKELTNAKNFLESQREQEVLEYDETVARIGEYNRTHPDMSQELPTKPEFYDDVKRIVKERAQKLAEEQAQKQVKAQAKEPVKEPVRQEVAFESLQGTNSVKTHIDGKKSPSIERDKEASSSL